MQIEIIIFSMLAVWLLALTVFFCFLYKFFNRLGKGVKNGNLKSILENTISQGEENGRLISELKNEIKKLDEDAYNHIQKTALVRFNAFREVGGDNSFCLALLDKKNSGVVVTVLHTRERTRIYAKDIKNGKSALELSSEEMKVLGTAAKS